MNAELVPLYRLMGLCARAGGEPHQDDAAHLARIAEQAARVKDWSHVATWAEQQGVSALLCHSLEAAGCTLPRAVSRALQALVVRHRLASRARAGVLCELLGIYAAQGIQVRFVKGSALAYMVYPLPELRPMGDVDLLVPRADVVRAQSLLSEAGFVVPLPHQGGVLPDRHLGGGVRFVNGFQIVVEVHYNLFSAADAPLSLQMEDLIHPALSFSFPGCPSTAQTLDAGTLLWHVCQHMRISSGLFGSNRLIWMADMVNTAERFVDVVDWAWVREHYPVVLKTLALLHFLIPISDKLRDQAGLDIGRAPLGIGDDFYGWPRASLAEQRGKGWGGILRDTFSPAEWWLRLYYTVGSAGRTHWVRLVRHPLHILRWVLHLFLERIGWYNFRH